MQISAITGLLLAFNVDRATVMQVEQILNNSPTTPSSGGGNTSDPAAPVMASSTPYVPPIGSAYIASSDGYDLSFATTVYPTIPFGFAVVGVTGGKAFVHNPRIVSEYSWAHFGSGAAPTVYMNLNAAYGSTVTAANVSGPQNCTMSATAPAISTTTATTIYPEPSVCESYNYGYNAAKDSYMYATNNKATSSLWWLDIEEANSPV